MEKCWTGCISIRPSFRKSSGLSIDLLSNADHAITKTTTQLLWNKIYWRTGIDDFHLMASYSMAIQQRKQNESESMHVLSGSEICALGLLTRTTCCCGLSACISHTTVPRFFAGALHELGIRVKEFKLFLRGSYILK